MTRLLVKLALLVGPIVILTAGLAPRHAIEGVSAISSLRYQIYRAGALGDQIRAVATGDSHAAMGFRSDDPSIYSIAFSGENLSEVLLKTRFAARHLPALKAVFLQAQPHMFFPIRSGNPRREYQELFPAAGAPFPSPWRLLIDPCCRGELTGAALRQVLGFPPPHRIPVVDRNGFLEYPEQSPYRGDLSDDARREILTYGETVPNPDMRRQYEEVVAELRGMRLEVFLTRYPLVSGYRAILDDQMQETDAFLAGVAARYGARRCGSWDAVADESLFFNADHLSPEGASWYWRQMLRACAANALHNDA